MINDVIIIGGGAAGLCAAVYLKQKMPSLSVRLLESQPRVGKKLALTGNGRCNITNTSAGSEKYDNQKAGYALQKFGYAKTVDFFKDI